MTINQSGGDGFTIDIQTYRSYGKNKWAQKRFLVHGIDDCLWTSSIEEVLTFIREELKRIDILAPMDENYINLRDKELMRRCSWRHSIYNSIVEKAEDE